MGKLLNSSVDLTSRKKKGEYISYTSIHFLDFARWTETFQFFWGVLGGNVLEMNGILQIIRPPTPKFNSSPLKNDGKGRRAGFLF